jgi:hypothetical protein
MVTKCYSLKKLVLGAALLQLHCVPLHADDNTVTGRTNKAFPTTFGMQSLPRPDGGSTPIPGMSGLHFIENKGQIKDQHGHFRKDIDFRLSTGGHVQVFIGSGNVHYQWNFFNPQTKQSMAYRMDLALVGANKNAEIVRGEAGDYYERYFSGAVGEGIKALTYNKITYRDIYPNIDWELVVNNGKFEYNFVVRPGGRVSDIKLQYNGAESLQITKEGNLIARTPTGSITELAPVSFEANGRSVASRFQLNGNVLSFRTAKYNAKETFIIDPVVEWATYYGGIGAGYSYEFFGSLFDVAEWDIGLATAFDHEKNVFFTGYTNSLTNIATTGAFQQTWGGSPDTTSEPNDAFLVKFDATGKRLWGTYYGGFGSESGNGIACDEFGNVYMVGGSSSTDVSLATTGSHQATRNGVSDAFLVKFDGAGNRVWATYFGGPGSEEAKAVVSDKGGHVYIAGNTTSASDLAAGSVHQTTFGGRQDAFLAKFTEGGNLEWATYFGGGGQDEGKSLAWDAQHQLIYLGGQTDTSAGLATPNVHQQTIDQGGDAFVARFTVQGQREWSTYFGGDQLDYGTDVECDDAGNIYLTGTTASKTLATPGAFIDNIATIGSYLTKFFPDGTRDWTTYVVGNDLYVAVQGLSIYVGGQTADTVGVATPGAPYERPVGAADVYMIKFDTSGVRQWGTYFGSSANDNGGYLDCDGHGNIYLTGRATNPSQGGIGLATPGAHQDTFATGGNAGSWDAFLVKFSDCVTDLAITVDSLTLGVTGSSVYRNYQWYRNDTAIAGATNDTYTVSKNGVYSVSVVSALNGCPDSAWYEVTNIIDDDDDDVSVADMTADAVRIYPNPAQRMVNIEAPFPVDAQLKTVDGRLVLRQRSVRSVDLGTVAPGIYLLQISDSKGRVLLTEKLIKEER